jgi:hypothetical protein
MVSDERSREEPRTRVAVAITWSPRLLLATTFSVIRLGSSLLLASAASIAVTSPLNVTVS